MVTNRWGSREEKQNSFFFLGMSATASSTSPA
jgi:hypothetical protein